MVTALVYPYGAVRYAIHRRGWIYFTTKSVGFMPITTRKSYGYALIVANINVLYRLSYYNILA